MAKATVPYAPISAFQAAGLLLSSDGEEDDRQFDRTRPSDFAIGMKVFIWKEGSDGKKTEKLT
jgi:hypothetical protein